MRLVVIAIAALAAGLAGLEPALAQDNPACADKARQWSSLRDSRDADALARFRMTIPTACVDLRREVDVALDLLSAAKTADLSGSRVSGDSLSGDEPVGSGRFDSQALSLPSGGAADDGVSPSGGGYRAEEQARERAYEQERARMAAARAAEARQRSEAAAAARADSARQGAAKPGAVAGAVARSAPSAPAPPSSPSIALPAGYEIVSHVLTPTESYLPKLDGMPTGIVLLDSREKAKNQSLCRALLGARTATVRTEAAARRDNPAGDFLITHWPVTGAVANQGDCGELLEKYDFARAKRVKNAYALDGSRGPLFLALDPTGQIVFLDLNDASADAVFKATSDWMTLALASPQDRPVAEQHPGLVAGTNRLFADLATGLASLVGAGGPPPTVVRFNDPVAGTSRQFNIYRAGIYLIGATFAL